MKRLMSNENLKTKNLNFVEATNILVNVIAESR